MGPIQFVEEAQLAQLPFVADAGRRREIGDGIGPALKFHALIHRRHEAAAPGTHAVHHLRIRILHDHEGWQILILRTEPVGHP